MLDSKESVLIYLFSLPLLSPCPGHASGVTPHSTAADPAETEAVQCLEKGTQKLEEGDVHGAKELYKRSAEMRRDAGALFNLGVTHYHLSQFINLHQRSSPLHLM